MTPTVFITGGAGFIGSRLTRRLAPHAKEIVVFDNLHPQVHGDSAAPPPFPNNVVFIRGDVVDAPALHAAVAKHAPQIIFHLAAETGTGQSYDEPSRYSAVNVLGTAHVIEAVRDLPTRPRRRLVLAGSRAVYGEGAYYTQDGQLVTGPVRSVEALARGQFVPLDAHGTPLTPTPTPEHLAPDPASVYASSKLMQEFLFTQCGAEGAFESIILRFQNVYGPGQSLKNPYTGVLSIFANQVLGGATLNIYEDGEIVRDFVFVDDVVDALARAADIEQAPTGPINIGSGQAATIRETASELLTLLGAPADRYQISGDFRPGDIRYAVANIERAQSILGWRPQTSLRDGLGQLAAWVKQERGV